MLHFGRFFSWKVSYGARPQGQYWGFKELSFPVGKVTRRLSLTQFGSFTVGPQNIQSFPMSVAYLRKAQPDDFCAILLLYYCRHLR
ncbi:MAG: hypothetical protein ACI81P_002814 [Neolewinella sp.]|jgi:hypothetical protein